MYRRKQLGTLFSWSLRYNAYLNDYEMEHTAMV